MNKMEAEFRNNKIVSSYEDKLIKKIPIPLFHEMPCKVLQKEKRKTFKYLFNRIRLKNCASATISKPHSTYFVAYLGNVVTGWAKGDGCIEKPLTTLWRNYTQSSRPDVNMQLTVSGGGLKAVTKNHGLTEYWAHRLTTCAAPNDFPRIFCWVYRHEGRRLKQELRCHAVLCSSSEIAVQIEKELKASLTQALNEFKKDKLSRQNARLSLVNSINEYPSLPRRKILLSTGSQNYRPPLEHSRSAPKLSSIEEIFGEEEDDIFNSSRQIYAKILKSYENGNFSLAQRKKYISNNVIGKTFPKSDTKQCHNNNLDENINNCIVNGDSESKDAHVNKVNSLNESLKSDDNPYSKTTYNNKTGNILPDKRTTLTEERSELTKCTTICDNEKRPLITSEDVRSKDAETEKKVDLDFRIGEPVLPTIKNFEKIPSIDHKFINPFISKGFLEQEQVSLVPVGETQSDFSSLKVYKKRSFPDGHKDIHIPCTIFQTGEVLTQIENGDQTNTCCSGENRYEEEITNKVNSALVV